MLHNYLLFKLLYGVYLYFISPYDRQLTSKTVNDIEMVILDCNKVINDVKEIKHEVETNIEPELNYVV